MEHERLSLHADAATIYSDHRAEYLAQLVAPLDDMWAAFADMATPHALMVGDDVAGSCSVDEDGQLLRFYVLPRFQHRSLALLRLTLRNLEVTRMMVTSLDPNYLSTALDLATSVEPHTMLYRSVTEPAGPELDDFRMAELGDHQRIVDFQLAAIGAPRDFLDCYVRERLERQELLLVERDAQLLCSGELRRDQQQAGISQLGVIVHGQARGNGIGSRMLSSLVNRSRELDLEPYCSTEVSNTGTRRIIERAGFRANHRLLAVSYAL